MPPAIIFLVVAAFKEWLPRLKPSRKVIMLATCSFLDNSREALLKKIKTFNGGKSVKLRSNLAIIGKKRLFKKVIKIKYYDSKFKKDDKDYDIFFGINEGVVGMAAYQSTVISKKGKKTKRRKGAQIAADLSLPEGKLMSKYNLTGEQLRKTRHLKSLLCTPIWNEKGQLLGFYNVDSTESFEKTCFDREEVKIFAIETAKNISINLSKIVI